MLAQKVHLKELEIHISHECNLSCKYCSHYCDFNYKGKIPFDLGKKWIQAWSTRLNPTYFRLLGGEPLLNQELDKYILCAAEYFTGAKRDVVTNGILLGNIEQLLPLFIETDTVLTISLHPVTKRQEILLHDALFIAHKWQSKGLKVNIAKSSQWWFKLYKGEGKNIKPCSEEKPELSWQNCAGNRDCRTIHQGKLWKCPPLAYLPLIFDQLEEKELWEPYLRYTPLDTNVDQIALENFAKGETFCCDMCPADGPSLINIEKVMPHHTIAGKTNAKLIKDIELNSKAMAIRMNFSTKKKAR